MAEGGLRLRLARQGLGLLAGGRVATLLLAGGQGSRLGHPGPKGTFPLAGDPERPLYKVLAERLVAVGRLVGRPVPWIILTSPQTDAETRAALAPAESWGIEPDQIEFVVQGQLPALDPEGRALLAARGQLALAPDGHGGALTALRDAGVLGRLRERGVQVLTSFQVDNPLARPVDPVMLGWMVEQKAQVVSKAVAKATPDERVGVYARDLAGRHRIVEYTELPEEGAEDLTLGSIALHALSVRWLSDLLEGPYTLPLHTARKRVPFLDASGTLVNPERPNAIKLERFFFDCFPEAERFSVHEVKREWEFAPIKNATGADSPLTAQLLVDAEVRRWHTARGIALPEVSSLRPLVVDGADSWQWPARIERVAGS